MNLIIDLKYASVYAAVHSPVWEAVSKKKVQLLMFHLRHLNI